MVTKTVDFQSSWVCWTITPMTVNYVAAVKFTTVIDNSSEKSRKLNRSDDAT